MGLPPRAIHHDSDAGCGPHCRTAPVGADQRSVVRAYSPDSRFCAAAAAAVVRELVDGVITRWVSVRLNTVSAPPWCAVALGLLSPIPAGLLSGLILGGGRGTVLVTCITLWVFIAALERPWEDKEPDAETRAIDAEARRMTREYFAEDIERISQRARDRCEARRRDEGESS